jgi:Beta-propeller repeat
MKRAPLISVFSIQPSAENLSWAGFNSRMRQGRWRKVSLPVTILLCLVAVAPATAVTPGTRTVQNRLSFHAPVRTAYSLLPLIFEPNQGQTNRRARFLAHGSGYTLFLTANGAVLALQDRRGAPRRAPNSSRRPSSPSQESVLRLNFIGANPHPQISGENRLPGKSNYFIGNDPSHWHTNVPTYAHVHYRDVYPGVDVVYYGRQGDLEDDFIVAPGASPSELRVQVAGVDRVRLSAGGGLVLGTSTGEVELQRPVAYQGSGRQKRQVSIRYLCLGHNEFTLEAKGYRRDKALIIDPVLSYATYLGGTGGDIAYGIAVDSSGDAYVTGTTASTNFPVKSAVQPTLGGDGDAFVAKLNPTGSGLIYSTYLGGTGMDSAQGIALDASGDAYIAGTTGSPNFPVTTGAFETTYGGGDSNAFVAKLGPTGATLTYATFLGGSAADLGEAIAIDGSGDAYVTGSTTSPNFPMLNALQTGNAGCTTTSTGVQTCTADGFITKLNPTGTGLVYSTYWGGSSANSGLAIAVDSQGECYVGGYTDSTDFPTQVPLQGSNAGNADGFISELNPTGSAAIFSTYWGGSGDDYVYGLTLDSAGNIYITGQTQSDDFPTYGNAYQSAYGGNGDAFVSKFASPGANGSTVVYSTYLGGSQADEGNGIALDSSDDAFVTGYTQSSDFPTEDPFQSTPGITGAGTCGTVSPVTNSTSTLCASAFITELNESGQPVYSSYLGGSENNVAQAVAVDSSGLPYVAGSTDSTNFPVISGALQSAYAGSGTSGNAFIAKIDSTDAPGVALTPQSVNFGNQTLNVASTSQAVTLINEGSAPLGNINIAGSGPFTENNNCGTTVAASGGTCTINIFFTPTVTGAVTNQISISDNAANSPQEITATGNGTNGGTGALTITPSSLTFPTEPVGATSPPQKVEIINTSNASVSVTGISISGQFVETNNCGSPSTVAPVVLNAGASCSAVIYFEPTSGGSQTGSFSITSNGSGSPSVSLTGSGGSLFTLSASAVSTNVVIGTTKTTFTIGASAPSSFDSTISLSCSSGVTCSFNPSSIKAGETSAMTVTGLTASSSNPTTFTVTGTASSQTSTVSLSIYFSDFSVTAVPAVANVVAGDTTTYTVSVNPLDGFNQVVLLSCESTGMPANTTCTWSPPGVTPNGSISASSTLTITTTSEVTNSGLMRLPRAPRPLGRGKVTRLICVAFAGLLCLLLSALAGYGKMPRKRFRRAYWLFVAAGLLLLSLSAVGCNDLYYQNNISPAPVGTPAGVFKLTLIGTLGSKTSVTRSTAVNLSVEPSP